MSQDNLSSAYLATRKERQKPRREAMLSELDAMMAAEAAPAPRPPQQASQQPQTGKPQGGNISMGDAVQDTVSAGIYAGAGLVDSVGGMVNDAVNVFTSRLFDYRFAQPDLSGALERAGLSKPKTIGGKIGQGLLQWAIPYTGALKAAAAWKPATKLAQAGKAAAAGAVADVSAFSPEEKRLSDLLVDFGDRYPVLKNPVTEFLASAPGDSHAESRMKNVLEGAGLGLAADGTTHLLKDGLFPLLKATRDLFHARGKDPLQALQEAADESAKKAADPALAVDTSKAPDLTLQRQIELVTGASKRDGSAAQWQKRLDVQAAVKAADQAPASKAVPEPPSPQGYDPNLAKTAEGIEAVPPSRPLTQAERNEQIIRETMAAHEKALAEGQQAHKAVLDTESGEVILTKEAPTPQQLDLDLALPEVVKKPKAARTPQEESALQSYKQLQEAALSKNADAHAKAPTEPVAASKEAPQAHAYQKGDTVSWTAPDGSRESGHVVGLTKNGKLIVKTGDTGAPKVVTPDPVDELMAGIQANNEALLKAAGKQQGGFIAPSVLAQLAAAQAGGVAGFMSADDDATLADKLSMAGMGALAGLGIARVGAEKVLSRAEREAIEQAPEEVRSLARKEVRNIAPITAPAKKSPPISKAKVDKLVEAAKSGDIKNLTDAARASDFNFDHIDTADDVKEMVDAFSAVFEKETSLATHGKQSFENMKDLAEELGAGEKSLRELYKDTDNLGARILAHRALLAASAEKVTSLARMLTGSAPRHPDLTDADLILSVRKQVALHASIQAQMKGVQTEVGRALAQFRITSSSVDLAVNERNLLIEAMGGHKANMEFAQKLASISDPKKLAAVTRKGAMARTQDALYEAWVNGLLSSPITHAVNAVGNSLVAIGSVAERGTAALIGKVLRTDPREAVQMAEAKALLFGMSEGALDAVRITKHGLDALKDASGMALRGDFKGAEQVIKENQAEFGNAWEALATDTPVLDNAAWGTKEFDLQSSAISADRFGLDPSTMAGHFADGLGAVLRTPGRLLTTSDELFKTIHYRGELKAQAYRIATGEGLEGEALFRRIAGLVNDPTPELRAQALQAARQGTFTSPLGVGGSLLQGAIHNLPGARYIMPFVRTPTNIMKYVGVRTPVLNLMAESVRNEFRAGGARRDIMLAKTTLGGMLYAAGAYLAAQGIIVGGGEKDQSAEKLGGIQPYSVKIGDTYYAFNRADPFGMFLGLAADVADISGNVGGDEADELASAAVLALSRNLVSKSYLSGVVNLIEALSEPDRKLDHFLQNFAASFTPLSALSNTIRKEEDSVVREVWSITDAIRNRIPGLSKDLPPALNIFGEEVRYRGGLGPDIASPIMTSEASTEPAAAEIARLNLDLRRPPRTIGGGNGAPGVDLSPKQYHRLMQLLGEGFKPDVTEMVQSEDYKALPEDPSNTVYLEAKEKSIRLLYEAHKRAAVAQLLEEDAELMSRFEQNLQNAGNALSGAPVIPILQPQ